MLRAIDYQSENAAAEFVESLHDTGFGVLKNHPLPESLVQSIYHLAAEFFASADKQDYLFNPQRFDGFFPVTISETAKGASVRDWKEYYHYYPWGQCPVMLKSALAEYSQQASALAATLLTWVEAYSPPAVARHYREPLSQMIENSTQTLLRVLHYPPLPPGLPPQTIRAAAHEDINLLTVLPAANEPGLQVWTRAETWLDVPSDFGFLIVNIGDMLQEASQGYFPSTKHRVINPTANSENKSRFSLPLFLHPRPEVVLSERHTAGSYLTERLRELGFKA